MQLKRILVTLSMLLGSSSVVGQSAPNLADTLKWLDQTYNASNRGFFQQFSGTKLWSEYTQTFTYDQCRVTSTLAEPFGDAETMKHMWLQQSIDVFNLGDIEPLTIKVIPHSSRASTDCTD